MKAPDNLWFMALKPSGVFKSTENCRFFSINTCFLFYVEAGMIINVCYCIFFSYFLKSTVSFISVFSSLSDVSVCCSSALVLKGLLSTTVSIYRLRSEKLF